MVKCNFEQKQICNNNFWVGSDSPTHLETFQNSQTMVWSSLTRKPLHQARVQDHSQPHSLLRREYSESPHLQGGNIRVDKIVKNQNTSVTSIGGGRLVSSGRIVKV